MHLKHIVEAQQFDVKWLEEEFFPLANHMADITRVGGCEILKGKRMITFFYEPSTRTRASFEIAMDMIGGKVVFSTENAQQFSSVVKGETLLDTIRVLNRYLPDVIVIRHHQTGSAKIAAEASERASIINAGDGSGQHPTQALLDLYTIRKRLKRVAGITVVMVGDLKNGRTIRSLTYLLGKYPGVKIIFVAPESLRVGEDIKEYLLRHSVTFHEVDDLRDVADSADVIYQTRTQKERGGIMNDDEIKHFTIDRSVLDLMKKDAIIMHPLPRNAEISVELDSDPRAVYLTDQIDSGLFTRMALLKLLLNP